MSDHSKIEWTDATWNPLRGCTKISPGCKHCYAETFAERFRGVPGHPYEQGFDLRLVPEKLTEPFHWSGPRTVFVNSMSDLFQPDVPDDYIEDVVRIMVEANWHTYQVLTKRSDRLTHLLATRLRFAAACRHIWWGVSVEDTKYGLPRIAYPGIRGRERLDPVAYFRPKSRGEGAHAGGHYAQREAAGRGAGAGFERRGFRLCNHSQYSDSPAAVQDEIPGDRRQSARYDRLFVPAR